MNTNLRTALTSRGRFSWRKGKSYDGLRRLSATYELRNGGKQLATAQQNSNDALWFWYGGGNNTAHRPDTLENVKADAVAHFKATGA